MSYMKKSKKLFSCEAAKFVAVSNVVVETNMGSFNVKKGSVVLVAQNEDNNPVILRKGAIKEGSKFSYVEYHAEINNRDVFNSFFEEVVVAKEELSSTSKGITMESLNKLIVQEDVKLETVLPFIIKNKALKVKESVKISYLPVFEKAVLITPSQRMAKVKALEDLAKNPSAKRAIIKGLKFENKSFKENGFIVNEKKINEDFETDASEASLIDFVSGRVSQSLDPNTYSVEVTGNSMKVMMNGGEIGSFDFIDEGYNINVVDGDAFGEIQDLVDLIAYEYFNDFEFEDAEDEDDMKTKELVGESSLNEDNSQVMKNISSNREKIANLTKQLNDLRSKKKSANPETFNNEQYKKHVDYFQKEIAKLHQQNSKLRSTIKKEASDEILGIDDTYESDYDQDEDDDKEKDVSYESIINNILKNNYIF